MSTVRYRYPCPQQEHIAPETRPYAPATPRFSDQFGNTHTDSLNFVIWAPPFTLATGGSIALHRLAHNLATAGHNAFLWARSKNPEWKGTLMPERNRPELFETLPWHIANPVMIYPDCVIGNPLHAVHVVRWILSTPGERAGDGVYGANDLVFKWSEEFETESNVKSHGLLTAWRDFSRFQNLGRARTITCYAVRKGYLKPRNQHPPDAVWIDNYGSERDPDGYLIDIFNRSHLFICYDHQTMLPVLATLCGCVAVVIPDGIHTREEIEARGGFSFAGIAWGREDQERAHHTLPQARRKFEEKTALSRQQTETFIEICRCEFFPVRYERSKATTMKGQPGWAHSTFFLELAE